MARGAALLVVTGITAGTVGVLTAPAANAAAGTAAGRVFRDYNMNGAFDTTTSTASPAVDVGISGVTVTAYDKDNNQVGTATSGSTGTYSISYTTTTSSSKVRLEFGTPTGMVASRAGITGATNDSDVQFVNTGTTTADYALTYPQDYAPANPTIAFARQIGAIKFDGTAQTSTAGTVFTNPYNTRGTTTTTAATKEATFAQTGSVWGTATLGSDYIFSSAFLKRHAPIGPGGIGAVYVTTAGGATDATTFATVADAGTDPRTNAQTNAQWFNDVQGYVGVGKVSLGGMVIAPDNSALYVVNLNAKTLVKIPITVNAAGVPSAGTQSSVAIPTPSCSGTLRPFGVGSGNGALWVTQTCAATAAGSLAGYVYKFDLATGTFASTPAVTVPLTGSRGFAYNGGNQSATWEVWQDSTGTDVFPSSGSSISNPQPLLSDVAFDSNGDMSIGVKDRFGDQSGFAGKPTANNTERYETMAAGDTLRACGGPTTWTLESNGVCGSRTGYGAGNGDGPGGGEFYADDFNTNSHDQVSLGGLLQVPGFPHLLGTTFDPKPAGGDSEYGTNGYRFWANGNGQVDAATGWRQIGTAARATGEESTYGKAGGMGDLDMLVKTPAEIGNRIWIDTDRDGIQDAEESGVSGVQVRLYDAAGTTVLATTTTNTAGEYYFNDANFAAIAAGTSYVVKIDRASDYASGGALFGYTTTTQNVGAKDKIDSDATTVGGFGQLAATTPKFGADHSFDVGFYRKAVSVGDFVWVDTDKDGIQESGEPGISGVTVTVTGPGGAAVTDVLGNAVTSTTTNASGGYTFANLPALASGQSYTVAISNTQPALADYVPTVTGAGTAATDSSNGTAASGDLVNNGASDTTLDFGFVRKAVSVGDYVWVDTNRNGVQDAGESGLSGVTVTLVGPTGAAVTDVNGTTVGATTTNAAGAYSFTNLPTLAAGQSYTVKIDNTQAALANFVPTTTGAGTTATDSSNGSAVSVTTLTTNGASDLTLDFGFVRKAVTVGDYVWVDTNRDGVQTSGEPGLAGVTVTLVGPTGAAVTNVNGATVGPVVTDANGAYSFGLLPVLTSGQSYTVKIDNTQAALSDFVPTVTGAGTTATDSSNGSAVSVTTLTTNGASDLTLDFGFVRKAVSVGDYVWVDANRDGVQQGSESGISGVTVTITRTDGATVKTTTGATVTSTTTNASGAYSFTNLEALPAGTHYKVSIDNGQAALSAYVPTVTGQGTAATDSSTGSAESTNLTGNGDSDTTLDFGFVKPAVSVGDFVWVDANKNGVQDAGEPGLSGVTVTIVGPTGAAVTDVNGTAVGATTTGVNGGYSFTNLPALAAGQSYTVKIDNTQAVLSDYLPTTTGAGTVATDSSNGSAASGNLTTNGASDTTLDFGFFRKSVTVGDFVWVDTNRNGVQDAGEPGISGVTVTLVGPTGNAVTNTNGVAVGAATTNASGAYSFTNLPVLPAGSHYTVKVDNTQAALSAYVPTLTGQGTAATDSSTSTSESGNLTTNGASDLTLDFGFVKPAVSVGDYVWVDANKNGVQDAGESGLQGVTVTLVGPGGNAVTNVNGVTVGSTTTNANGAYSFDLLPALAAGQSYTVKVDNTQAALSDYVPTTTGAGTAATDSSNGSAASGNLTTNGASDNSLDFGFFRKSVSVGDYVWLDTNRDGVQNAAESGIAGVVVTLVGPTGTAVTNVNGTTVGSTTTNAAGAYSFTNLPALPAGQHYTVKIDNTQAALAAYVPTITGAGTAATDSSTATSESGNLPNNGDADLTLDFGFVKPAVSVGDFVFVDTNANGVQNAGEPGLPGVTVTIVGPGGNAVTNVNGNTVAPVVTDANGAYTFTLLPALAAGQSYTVKIDNTQGALASYVPAQTGQGTTATDSSNGSAASGILTTNGASDTTLDFGFVRKSVSVGDYVWLDTNRDGIQNAAENGIAGVKLTIVGPTGNAVTDVNGAAVGTATTNAAGAYSFTNLPALAAGSHYTVKVDNTQAALASYVPTLTGQGTAATDSSTATSESGNLPNNGDADLTLDFGFVKPAVSVGDFVFVDTNANGVQNAGEPGLPGVTVTIVGPGGNAVTNVNGNTVAPVVTDANGAYTFTLLPALAAGQSYTVKIDNTQGALASYVPAQTGQGTTATDSSNGSAASGILTTNGASDNTLDFGFVRKAVTVGDYVWLDTNRDGVQNAAESGIAGVKLTIVGPTGNAVTDVNGTAVGVATTDASGKYLFTNLPALAAGSHYTVKIDNTQAALAAYVPTLTGAGTAATDSSTASAESGNLPTNGDSDLTLDFGFVKPAVSVGDFVFVDTNANGVQNAGEPGLSGVTVTLVGPGGNAVTNVNGTTVAPVVTNAAGAYSFDLLPALAAGQSYTVKVDNTQAALSDYVPTITGAGTPATDSSNGSAASGNLTTNGASDTTLDFGFVRKAVSVGDLVWLDANRDGIQQAAEAGIAGVKLTLVGPTGTAVTDIYGTAVGAATTDANGAYSFTNLPALAAGSHYTVKIDNAQAALASYVPTLAGQGADTAKDSSTSTAESTNLVTNGASDLTLDFGFVKPRVTVGDFVWLDTNRDGVQNAAENGIAGVKLTIVGPTGTAVTDIYGTAVGAATTNAAGAYSFTDLPVLPAGSHYTVKIDNTQAALAAYVPTATGAGTAATDSSNGSAESGNLTTNGAQDLTLDFGFVKPAVSVGDFVWVDSNGNGVQNAGEPGLAGVTVTLVGPDGNAVTNVNGTTVAPVVTDANGAYTFTLLPALAAGQSYTVKIDNTQAALGGFAPTVTGAGTAATDSSTGSAASGSLTTNGASDNTLDFGFVRTLVTVGDYVWLDSNRDGIQNASESGIAGVKLTIVGPTGNAVTNVNGNAVGAATTNAAGAYLFTALPVLPAGSHYTVKVDNTQAALAAYVPTLAGQGADTSKDSSTASAESGNLPTNGASDLTLDFGFVKPAVSVGDFVWVDGNGNGVQNAGEPGLAGVTVTLVGPGGNAVTNVNGNAVGPVVTDANGAYSFTLLPALAAGQSYTVKIDNTQAALSAFVPTTTGAGTPATDSSNGSAASGNLTTNGASDNTLDFGFVRKAVSVGDYVWLDTNRDGIQNAAESGIAGVKLTIVGPTGNAVTDVDGNAVGAATTSAAGAYSFTNLPALAAGQSYTVKIDNTQAALASYVPTITGAGTAATDSSTGSASSGNLTTNGASDTTLDFGFVKPAVSVGDFVWSDINGNGVQDAGEPGIGGVKLTLVGPDGNPVTNVFGNPVGTATTGSNGSYTFTNLPVLPAGEHYTVKVDNTQPALAGYEPTQTGQGTPATDSSNGSGESGNLTTDGASDKTIDFGFVPEPVVPPTGVANLVVKKTVDVATPHIGDTVTYTVTVTNTGDAAADNVVMKDLLPSGLTFVSASAPCTQASGTVACDFGTIAAGGVKTVTITATVDNTPAGTTEERHGLDVQKAEAVLDLDAGQTASQTVACQPGYVVLDGSARITHVDGGTGTLADVTVLESRSSATGTWKVTLTNNATGRAQTKVFALCVQQQTETVNGHSHQLQVSAAPVTETEALPAGRTDVTLSCAPGETPVQPGWVLDGGATVPTSYPSGASSWVFGVLNDDATTGTFTIRCLKNQTSTVAGHSHDLLLGELFRTVTVPAGQDVDVVLDCADSPLGNQGAKGIVAGYDLAPGLLHLGNEPQPIRRVFTLSNPTGTDLQADLWLLCMGTRTAGHDGSGTIVNTATATTSSPETTTNDNSSSATITVTAAPVVETPKANLRVSKTVSDTTPRVGDTVTYTLKVTNDSDTAADDVVLTDPLPAGVTYVASSAPGTVTGSTVTYSFGTVAAGATKTVTVTAKVDAAPAAASAHAHLVDVQKNEAQIDLAAGATRTVTVDCGPGYFATDGSGRVDQIDQGSGTPDAVRIAGSHAVDADTWSVTLVNGATGNAQGKVFVVCAKATTEVVDGHSHAVAYSAPVTQTAALPTGVTEVTLSCGPGTTPIQPGFQLTGSATVRTSYPVAGGWKFVIDNPGAAASGDFSIRCLNTSVTSADGHQHTLTLTPVTQTVIVGAGQTVEVTTSCAGDAKGIVHGFAMDKGLVALGNDPRPIVRVSRFYNPTNSAKSVELSLLCLNNRTTSNTGSGAVTNTAYASTSTPETTTGDNTASASFKVDTSAIATPASSTVTVSKSAVVTTTVKCGTGTSGCKGTAYLVALKTQTIAGKTIKKGTVLAKTTFKITAGKVVTVKLKPTAAGKKALKSASLKTAQVKVGTKTKTVQIRR